MMALTTPRITSLVHHLPVSICLIVSGLVNFHGRLQPLGPLGSVNSLPAISTFFIPLFPYTATQSPVSSSVQEIKKTTKQFLCSFLIIVM
jgi:hypothetical protein